MNETGREYNDLGSGFFYTFFIWDPDRKLNPQYKDVPRVDPAGILIWRRIDDKMRAIGAVNFDIPVMRQVAPKQTYWDLISLNPLHIEPSIQMYESDGKTPSYHGWIREGKWVSA